MRDIDKLFLVFLALCAVLVWMGSVLDREDTYQPQFAINETYIKELEAARHMNIDVWLAPNMTENYTITVPNGSNVTIWKGDKMVAYIPR